MGELLIELQTAPEKTTRWITGVIKNELDVAVPGSALQSLTMVLYDERTGVVINNQDGTADLRTQNGAPTVDEEGKLSLRLNQADMVILNAGMEIENHIALLTWSWLSGGVTLWNSQEFRIPVENHEKVT